MSGGSGKIVPEKDLAGLLLSVQTPGRYVGGEYGVIVKPRADYRVALCFPDLYEIGMSNLAIRLMYKEINALDGVACERVFCPAPDFEEGLLARGIPLYTLETGTPLGDCDLLGFSYGYELAAGNLLTVLNTGEIPLRREDRGPGDPLVIAGGPAITNPAPLGEFLDGVWIGEAEEAFPELLLRLKAIKQDGGGRGDQLAELAGSPHFWYPGKTEKTTRNIWTGFTSQEKYIPGFLVPNIAVVQDHGIVEIMRGCGTGCRFCHAGFFYRPYRQKSLKQIKTEVDFLVRRCGYREVTLSSLSSGDYNGIGELVRGLNRGYAEFAGAPAGFHASAPAGTPAGTDAARGQISFSFPSLKVNTMTLPLLNELSRVRKSGLTFAVETPGAGEQRGLNKEVPREDLLKILEEAKAMGWKLVKFYFMLGLPFSRPDEGLEIAGYINEIRTACRMNINVNIGTFIPKPHTPFQWAAQLTEGESFRRLQDVRHNVNPGIKVGFHAPFTSALEGILSRGGGEISGLIYGAWKNGARLDAWEEHLDKDLWRRELAGLPEGVLSEIFDERAADAPLPWDGIELGGTKGYLRGEWEKAQEQTLTSPCPPGPEPCPHPCGTCRKGLKPENAKNSPDIFPAGPAEPEVKDGAAVQKTVQHERNSHEDLQYTAQVENNSQAPDPIVGPGGGPAVKGPVRQVRGRLLFQFSKTGKAVYYSHINVMQIFERAFLRCGVPAVYTQGFNPKPRLEFAHPLALGQASLCEIAAVEIPPDYDFLENSFIADMNRALPEGFEVVRGALYRDLPEKKIVSLMSLYAGSLFRLSFADPRELAALTARKDDLETLGVSFPEGPPEEGEPEEGQGICRIRILQKKGAGRAGKAGSPVGLKKILAANQNPAGCLILREAVYAHNAAHNSAAGGGYSDYFTVFASSQNESI